MRKYVDCSLCGSELSREVYRRGDLRIVKCRECGFVYQSPRTSQKIPEERSKPEEYYEFYVKTLERQKGLFHHRIESLLRDIPSGRILDVGCGLGTFLEVACEKGWDGYGVEVSRWAWEFVRAHSPATVYNRSLEESKFPDAFFDVVHMSHVLEHFEDPIESLSEVKRILKDGGRVIIEVPNEGSFKSRYALLNLVRDSKRTPLFAPDPLHYYFFTKRTLSLMLKKAGFKVITNRVEGYGAPGRANASVFHRNRKIRVLLAVLRATNVDVLVGLGSFIVAVGLKCRLNG